MTSSLYDASAPEFAAAPSDMRACLDRPDAAQANALVGARLCGVEAPPMADTATSFAELRDRPAAVIAGGGLGKSDVLAHPGAPEPLAVA